MLVLSRKQQEKILIGKEIEVIVTHISPSRVKLAVVAPVGMRISRPESPLSVADEANVSELKKA